MIKSHLYKKLDGQKLNINGKSFVLEFDSDHRCFRLYQKSERLGTKDIEQEIQVLLTSKITEDHYLERVHRNPPRSDFLLLDVLTLKHLSDNGVISGIRTEIDSFAKLLQEEKREKEILADHQLDKVSTGRRVWVDEKLCYKSCIDSYRGMFIATPEIKGNEVITIAEETANIAAFRDYLVGKAYLRRKVKPRLAPTSLERKFAALHHQESEESLATDLSDIAVSSTSTYLPNKAPELVQGLLILPIFLTAVKAGIEDMGDELSALKDELAVITDNIKKCEEAIDNFKRNETFTLEETIHCFEAMLKLKESLEKVHHVELEAASHQTLGYPAMLMIFSAIVTYQLKILMSLGDKVPGLTEGVGDITLAGYDSAANAGALGFVGSAPLFLGETIMTFFVLAKIKADIHKYTMQSSEMEAVKGSQEISDIAKKVILDLKKDENFYNLIQIIGESILASGQITMAFSGPFAFGFNPALYAGFGLTIAGISTAVAAESVRESRHDFEKKASAAEEKVSQHYVEELIRLICEFEDTENSVSEDLPAVYQEVLRQKAFTSELFFHLAADGLVLHKIIKEGEESGSFEKGADAAKEHYKKHSHQNYLYNLTNHLVPNSYHPYHHLARAMETCKEAGFFAYKLLHEKLIKSLQINDEECDWIIELGKKLSLYEKKPNGDLIKEMSEIENLPYNIAQSLDSLKDEETPPSYDIIISRIQEAFLESRLGEDKVQEIVAGIKEKSEAERENELRELLLESEVKDTFTIEAAQEEYLKESHSKMSSKAQKQNYRDNPNSAIRIVGKVKKSGAGLFAKWFKSHKKNVYKINPELFEKVGKKAVNAALDTQKYQQRSLFFRLISEVSKTVTTYASSVKDIDEMVQTKKQASQQQEEPPHNDLHAERTVRLKAIRARTNDHETAV